MKRFLRKQAVLIDAKIFLRMTINQLKLQMSDVVLTAVKSGRITLVQEKIGAGTQTNASVDSTQRNN